MHSDASGSESERGAARRSAAVIAVRASCGARVLQCVAVCCSECVAVSVFQGVALCCSVLQCVAVCGSVMQCVAVSVLQCVAECRHKYADSAAVIAVCAS